MHLPLCGRSVHHSANLHQRWFTLDPSARLANLQIHPSLEQHGSWYIHALKIVGLSCALWSPIRLPWVQNMIIVFTSGIVSGKSKVTKSQHLFQYIFREVSLLHFIGKIIISDENRNLTLFVISFRYEGGSLDAARRISAITALSKQHISLQN